MDGKELEVGINVKKWLFRLFMVGDSTERIQMSLHNI